MKKIPRRQFIAACSSLLIAGALPQIAPSSSALQADIFFGPLANTIDTTLLSIEEAKAIADYHIATRLSCTSRFAGRDLTADKSVINLYDFNNNLIAYMVPIMEYGMNVGYITVSALAGGYSFYDIYFQDDIIHAIGKTTGLNASNGQVLLHFIPPMSYIIENWDSGFATYSEVIMGRSVSLCGIDLDDTSLVQTVIENVLAASDGKAAQIASGEIAANMAANAEHSLFYADENEFVPVLNTETFNMSYGGNQGWYEKSSRVSNGCGPVAAANITYYLAKQNSLQLTALYPYSNISESSFLKHMNTMYEVCSPSILGDFSLTEWRDDVLSYADKRNVFLFATDVTSLASFEDCKQCVADGLDWDSPVAVLNLALPHVGSDSEYNWHWMTITRLFESSGIFSVWVSTWGQKHDIEFSVLWKKVFNWGGGFCYFT